MLIPSLAAAETLQLCIPKGRSEFMEIVAVIARDKGYFKKRGLDVSLQQTDRAGGGGFKKTATLITKPNRLDYLVADKVSAKKDGCLFGASTVERFLATDKNRSEIRPLIMSTFGDQYDTHILVPKNSKITKVGELRGKKLRIGQLPTYVATLGALEAHGLSLKDVDVQMGFGGNEKIAGLEDGRIDATTAYLPAMAYYMALDRVKILEANIIQKYLGKRIPHSLLIVNADYAKKNAKKVSSFKDAMNEAHQYLMRNREEIFYSFSRSRGRATDVSGENKANIEKAASFVGNVPFIDMTADSADRDRGYCDIKFYGGELERRGLIAKAADLAPWIGMKPEKAASCPAATLVGAQEP